jgi:hypothetical protein
MISQGDIELSVISKNFFFVFFNFFIVFTILGTAALTPSDFGNQTPREIANHLASSIQTLRRFYVNYIILQGLALFPFRLLEFGSVFLYPIGLIGAKTPRGSSNAYLQFCLQLTIFQIMLKLCNRQSSVMASISRRTYLSSSSVSSTVSSALRGRCYCLV